MFSGIDVVWTELVPRWALLLLKCRLPSDSPFEWEFVEGWIDVRDYQKLPSAPHSVQAALAKIFGTHPVDNWVVLRWTSIDWVCERRFAGKR